MLTVHVDTVVSLRLFTKYVLFGESFEGYVVVNDTYFVIIIPFGFFF